MNRARTLGFPRSVRLRSRTDYLKVQRSGRRVAGRHLVLLFLPTGHRVTRFGITVSRKTGGAVVRNRVKRRLREIVRTTRPRIADGYDIVLIATGTSPRAPYADLEGEYLSLVRRAGLLHTGGHG